MKDVDAAIEAGVFGGFALNNWVGSLQVVTDITDEHDGSLVTLSGGYRYEANADLSLVPTLSTTYADSDYMQTYFGVNSRDSASSGLKAYSADSDFKDVSVSLIVDYHPWEKWKLVGGAVYKKLLNDAKNSPLVKDRGDDGQMIVGFMAAYRW
jgi:outer membrane scaffolding protein for murein synthesis (MipA/OmpV family)